MFAVHTITIWFIIIYVVVVLIILDCVTIICVWSDFSYYFTYYTWCYNIINTIIILTSIGINLTCSPTYCYSLNYRVCKLNNVCYFRPCIIFLLLFFIIQMLFIFFLSLDRFYLSLLLFWKIINFYPPLL